MSFDPKKVLLEQQEAQRSQSWILTKIHDFNSAHNRLKHHVHTAWRYPLPPWGRAIMGCVYFSIPVVAGYFVSSWVVSESEAKTKERFSETGMFFDAIFNLKNGNGMAMSLSRMLISFLASSSSVIIVFVIVTGVAFC